MITEIVELKSATDSAEELAAALPEAMTVLVEDPGCHGASAYQDENDHMSFVVVVDWESVEAHRAFLDSSGIEKYRALIGRYLAERPTPSHMRRLARRS